MSNQRRPISAHFARLSLNPNSRLVVTNKNNNNYNNKPFTSQPKSNKWELGGHGNKLRYVGCEQSDFAPTMKVTSLQPSSRSKPKANKNRNRNIQRQRPQTSNGILSKRRNSRINNNNNYNSAKMPQTDSNSRLLIYHHHILNNNNNKNKIKNYKNINASYSSSNVLHKTSAKNNSNNKDSVIFAIDPKHPLCPIVFRDEKAKMISRERLNLDNRNLNKCPILRGEENLRLLNYENNIICKISNLNNLQILIFLDLYNNRISKIENLDCVPLLRVLMLGRNEISNIENLDNLHCLDVLDLHSNKISKMENLNHLKELRVLNLAGNNISNVENISNLKKLVEINVRRNIIINIKNSFISHQKLQRILLSNNNITDIKTILCLTFAKSIQQLTIDNNPFYDKFTQNTLQNIHSNPLNIKIISMFKSLKQLNNFEISKNIRDHLLVTQNNNIKSIVHSDDEDQLLAQNNNLKENIQTENVADISDDDGNHIENDNDNELSEEELISKIGEEWMDDKNRKDGLKYHKLVTNNILKMYGCGFINNFNYDLIEEMHFYYIDFNELTKYFHYFKTLKSMNVLKFNHNNIHSLYQIDALSVLSNIKNVSFGLNNLSNKIVETSPNLYKMYCIFRLPNIIFIDNKKVTIEEKEIANKQFYYLREEWKNNKILLIKGFCAPILNQASNINENNDKNLHQIFESFPNVNNNKNKNDIDVDCDEKRELNSQKNMAKESIQHAINIYKSRQRIKALWPSIVADYIHEVINDLQMNSI